jgi:hypothetical protein
MNSQGRKKAMRMLKNLLQERQANPRKHETDFFDYVLEELQKNKTILTEEIALDLMFVLLFASFETTSLGLTLAVKFISDHPLVLKELTVCKKVIKIVFLHDFSFVLQNLTCSRCLHFSQEEHEGILKNRENANSGLTWKEYKSMKFTFQVGQALRHQFDIILVAFVIL